MSAQPMSRRRQELIVFILFTVFVAPALAIAIVGSYGFAIWMYQLINGPPTG
jgi:nitrate reductase NapE